MRGRLAVIRRECFTRGWRFLIRRSFPVFAALSIKSAASSILVACSTRSGFLRSVNCPRNGVQPGARPTRRALIRAAAGSSTSPPAACNQPDQCRHNTGRSGVHRGTPKDVECQHHRILDVIRVIENCKVISTANASWDGGRHDDRLCAVIACVRDLYISVRSPVLDG